MNIQTLGRRWARGAALMVLAGATFSACPDEERGIQPGDTVVADTSAADTGGPSADVAQPTYFPAMGTAADEVLALDALNLEGPVRVVYDDRGIPHIYGDSPIDLAKVQGFVTARDRMFQMHTLRMAASGRLAELLGPGALGGDLHLRMIGLRHAAEKMDAVTRTNTPDLAARVDAYAVGVNTYLDRLKGGLETPSIEMIVFGTDKIQAWSSVDTYVIVRLQTWDLGFDLSDADRLADVAAIREQNDGTPLAGVEADYFLRSPIREVAALEPEGGAKQSGTFDIRETLQDSFYTKLRRRTIERTRTELKRLEQGPHHPFRGPEYGSNNWIISGSLTADGKPLVANDTHLALRNPAVFYHVHVNNTRAGGALNINGVNFAGAPGIVLGHNDHAAWGATVFYSDVTDVYLERVDGTTVLRDGVWLDMTPRVESFTFIKPDGAAACKDADPSWLAAAVTSESIDGNVCTVEVTFYEVPDHGPILPYSYDTDEDGNDVAMSFIWTGLEGTEELTAVDGLATAATVDDFKTALNHFGVGAQNWVFGLNTGEIGWYPSHLLPKSKHIEAGDTTYPPFLPMPGHTSDTLWDGFVDRALIPQVVNPSKGWLATANGDPVGNTFDNDPFNDGLYLNWDYTPGFRIGRIDDRLSALAARGDITAADLSDVQGDAHSNFGATLGPELIAAVERAVDGNDTVAQAMVSTAVTDALTRLKAWRDLDFWAASGVGAGASTDEAVASTATTIFNTWVVFLVDNTLRRHEMHRGGDAQRARTLWRMATQPQTMASYDAERGDSLLWDDNVSDGVVVTKTQAMVKSLVQALDFLSDPALAGAGTGGGFGTADQAAWRWGALHVLKMAHNVAPQYDIPTASEFANGTPRHCDNFCVDASHHGYGDTDFSFSSGAAIRNVYQMTDPPVFFGVVPGGQSENPETAHYRDGFDLWAQNKAPQVPFTVDDVLAAKTKMVDFMPAAP